MTTAITSAGNLILPSLSVILLDRRMRNGAGSLAPCFSLCPCEGIPIPNALVRLFCRSVRVDLLPPRSSFLILLN